MPKKNQGKREGTDEEIINWCLKNYHRPRPPGYDEIMGVWYCGQARAGKISREAKKRLKEMYERKEDDDTHSEKMDIRQQDDRLTTNFTVTVKRGEELPLDKAIENPKLLQALQASDIRLEDFEVSRFTAKSWDVVVKLSKGKDQPDEPKLMTCHYFMIEWKRRKSNPLLIAMENLLESMPYAKVPRHRRSKRKGQHMVEIALYDVHFGMLAWAEEVGEDYDSAIARRMVNDACKQVLGRTKDLDIEYFLLPIGNDYLHVNNIVGQTPQNRNQLDVDTRFARIIEEGELALRDVINALSERAPVKVLWIPGNHDPQTSFFLLKMLANYYRLDGLVEVDTSPKPRKIIKYGKNLLGLMHGCDIASSKEKALAGLLADEAADIWEPGQYREIHRGHHHKKGELYFTGASTEGSVVVRTIPSLVGTDYWHFSKGFVETSKTAQYFVWNKTYGLESVNDIHVDKSTYSDNRRKKS